MVLARIEVKAWGQIWPIRLETARYHDERPAVIMTNESDGAPFGKLTVNIPEVELADNEITVKTWAENEAIVPQVFRTGLFIDTGRRVPCGGHGCMAHIWSIKQD